MVSRRSRCEIGTRTSWSLGLGDGGHVSSANGIVWTLFYLLSYAFSCWLIGLKVTKGKSIQLLLELGFCNLEVQRRLVNLL